MRFIIKSVSTISDECKRAGHEIGTCRGAEGYRLTIEDIVSADGDIG